MSSLQLDDDTEERMPGHSPTNDSSPRVSTPLSFQTFGAQQANSHPRDGVQRPSFDSAQSSSPSTEPPSTPHRQDTSPVILQSSSMGSKATSETADRPPKANRRFRIHNPADIVYRTTPDSPSPSTPLSPPPPPRTTKQDDVNNNEPTLRRIAKRRGRPALGVATYAPSASNVVVEASPLSPVVASPRSTMFQVASQTPTPAANANFQIGSPEPAMSPDVTLDLSQDPDVLVSPKGTRYITPPAPEKYVQYKPRKRITAPRKRSFVSGIAPDQVFQPIVLDEAPQSTLRKWSFSSSKPESPSASSTILRRFSKFTLSSTTATSGGPATRKASTDEGHGYASEDTGSRRLSIGRRLSHFVTGSRRQSFADARPAPESPDRRKVIMLQSHLSRPHPPLLQTPSNEGSTTVHHPSQPSTVTVRSSDGWYSTIPSSLTTQESVLSNVEPVLDLESPDEPAGLRPFKNASSSSVAIPNLRQHVQRANVPNTVSQSTPPSPIGPSTASGFPRPVSFQSRRFSGNAGSTIHDPLGGVPEPDGSVRLLDAATAAAIRRSVDFDDRVKRSEDMLRAAIYGPMVSASPRSSTVSISRTSMDRGRGGKAYQSSRSQSLDNRHGHHRIRTGSFGNVHSTTNTRDTRGGVFLPSSLEDPDDDGMIKRPIARSNTTLSYATPTRHERSVTPVPVMTHLPKIDDNHHHYTTMPASTTYDPPLPLRHRIGNKISRIFTGKPN